MLDLGCEDLLGGSWGGVVGCGLDHELVQVLDDVLELLLGVVSRCLGRRDETFDLRSRPSWFTRSTGAMVAGVSDDAEAGVVIEGGRLMRDKAEWPSKAWGTGWPIVVPEDSWA